ncbi:hypothetical protein [Sphingobacterium bambusae]|uniref:SMODS-associated and fused to various effectors domain-containing protein n=1 Tax=Sphingobacterium bambusae TaxID=662858 RepID=A0ABW6BJ57_9SPHI|nr:hypothetical protein [Sphingobacterium bambusae]WPL49357.1 hypothetical protein SCB77_02680 [Sphingobacterium bambusae]
MIKKKNSEAQLEEANYITVIKRLSGNLPTAYLFIAIILILLPSTPYSPFNEKINQLLEKIGFVAMTSGVFASVLKSIQFTGVFREELNKVISGSALLKNRKDLPDLWKKISKIIYSEKFPEINETLEDRILDTYFPTTKNHYNEDVVASIIIHELTDDFVIHYTQTIQYVSVLSSNGEASEFNFTSTLTDDENVEEMTRLISLKIDEEELQNKIVPIENTGEGLITYSITVPLIGKDRFSILHKMERRYSLKAENYKLLRFNTLTKNVDVTISFPPEIEVSFFGVGIITEFETVHEGIPNCISKRHRNDLILPKQGFGLSFNKK